AAIAQIDQHEMRVSSTGHDVHSTIRQRTGERLCICDDLRAVGPERKVQSFLERNRLRGYDVFQRTTLGSREHGLVYRLRVLGLAQNETAARAAQRLVRGGSDGVSVRNR